MFLRVTKRRCGEDGYPDLEIIDDHENLADYVVAEDDGTTQFFLLTPHDVSPIRQKKQEQIKQQELALAETIAKKYGKKIV